MKFIKSLMLSGCFCISMAWADMNDEGLFVELTSRIAVGISPSFPSRSAIPLLLGGGMGYKYNSSNDNYFGYFQGKGNLETAVGEGVSGIFDFEYGYEFRRESSFSFGVSISPILATVSYVIELESLALTLDSSLGVFGNIRINDSFLVSIKVKGDIPLFYSYIMNSPRKALPPSGVLSLGIKGKYFF